MAHAFRACALAHPGRVLAAQRAGDEWISISWGAAREQADAIAQALLDRGLGAGRPLMVLSGNSIEHVVLTLGAYTAGVPIVPGQHRLLAAVRRPRAHPRCRRAVPAGVGGERTAADVGAELTSWG